MSVPSYWKIASDIWSDAKWFKSDLVNILSDGPIGPTIFDSSEIRLDKYWEHQDVKFEYKASIQNKENTGNHTEISYIKEEIEVDIVAESQRPQMT